jgi:hypothetical protein
MHTQTQTDRQTDRQTHYNIYFPFSQFMFNFLPTFVFSLYFSERPLLPLAIFYSFYGKTFLTKYYSKILTDFLQTLFSVSIYFIFFFNLEYCKFVLK